MSLPERPEPPEGYARRGAGPCVANLNPQQSARRLVLGLVTLAAAAAGLVVLVQREEPAAWRAALFPVWWAGMYGLLQARRRT